MANNPSFVAYQEIKNFFPNAKISNFVSIGNGRYIPELKINKNLNSSNNKESMSHIRMLLTCLSMSATRTDEINQVMKLLLPSKIYFRVNPTVDQLFLLNESKKQNLEKMGKFSKDYIENNDFYFNKLCNSLTA
ncbi:MAG: Calcium-independent phospholipase A2-gamma [Paramarteilia canceri]